jgi:hypothetical protein
MFWSDVGDWEARVIQQADLIELALLENFLTHVDRTHAEITVTYGNKDVTLLEIC